MALTPLNLLLVTFNALRGNPVRSLLTTLGVFMGIVAVNSTLQVQVISEQIIEAQLASQLAPQIFTWMYPGGITPQRMSRITGEIQGIAGMTGMILNPGWQVRRGNYEALIQTYAVSPNYLAINGLKLVAGRGFQDQDFANFRAVGIIDQAGAKELFPDQDPIGQTLIIGSDAYRIIGIMEAKPFEKNGRVWSTFIVPIALAYAQQGHEETNEWTLQPEHWQEIPEKEAALMAALEQQFPDRNSGTWSNVGQIADQQEVLTLVSRGLLGVGLIALVISGVGIANITLASVLQRRPEIGLRRAIGATPGDILRQFLLEAIALSLIGGGTAILVVHIAAQGITAYFDLPYRFQSRTAWLSLATATIVGAGSSFFPARRASNIEPMSALRDD